MKVWATERNGLGVDPMTKNEAFNEGYEDYWEGVDVTENPFDPEKEPDEHKSWDEGWREARKHDYDERDW